MSLFKGKGHISKAIIALIKWIFDPSTLAMVVTDQTKNMMLYRLEHKYSRNK